MRVDDEKEVVVKLYKLGLLRTTTTVRWCQYFDIHIESFFTTFIIFHRHNWFALQDQKYKKITKKHKEKNHQTIDIKDVML